MLSVFAGVLAGLIAFICFAFFFMAIGMFGWTDGGSPEEMKALENNSALSMTLMTLIGSMVAGYITAVIAISDKLLYTIISGIIIILIFLVARNFDFSYIERSEIFSLLFILPFVVLGGWLRLRRKSLPSNS